MDYVREIKSKCCDAECKVEMLDPLHAHAGKITCSVCGKFCRWARSPITLARVADYNIRIDRALTLNPVGKNLDFLQAIRKLLQTKTTLSPAQLRYLNNIGGEPKTN